LLLQALELFHGNEKKTQLCSDSRHSNRKKALLAYMLIRRVIS
jgi:hypothetical protein